MQLSFFKIAIHNKTFLSKRGRIRHCFSLLLTWGGLYMSTTRMLSVEGTSCASSSWISFLGPISMFLFSQWHHRNKESLSVSLSSCTHTPLGTLLLWPDYRNFFLRPKCFIRRKLRYSWKWHDRFQILMRSSFSCSLDFDWWYKYTVVLNLGLVSFGGKPGHSGVGKVLGSIPLGGLLLLGCFDGLPNTNPRVIRP